MDFKFRRNALRNSAAIILAAVAMADPLDAQAQTITGDVLPDYFGLYVVGRIASGSLTIATGETVATIDAAYLGYNAGAPGTVEVSGENALFSVNGSLTVGRQEGSTMTISAGGKVTSAAGNVALGYGITSTVVVKDAGSLWDNSGALTVGGSQAFGFLTIEDGGRVNSASASLGDSLFSAGTVSVTGANSLWANSGRLVVGNSEVGILTISNGGTVKAGTYAGGAGDFVGIAGASGSSGTLVIGAESGSPALAGTLMADEVRFGQGTGRIVFNHTGLPDGSAVELNATLLGRGTIMQENGTTVLSGNGSAFTGSTIVSGGKLIVADTLGGSAQVTGGALQFGNGTTGAANSLGGDLSIAGSGSALAVQGTATLSVAGDVNLDAGTILAIGTGLAPSLQADTLTLGSNVALNITGIDSESQLDKVLIDTTHGISGDFGTVTVGGFSGPVDYLTVNTHKSTDGSQYLASYDLSWTAGNTLADGTFTLTNPTDGFTVGTVLSDQTGNAATGWDGTSLTKAGAGTLILSADNTYTGDTTISGGTVQIGDGNTTGSILGNVLDNGALAFDRSDAIAFGGTISGSGAVRQFGSGTLILSGGNSYSGGTEMRAGTLSVAADANLGAASGGLTFSGGALAATASFDTGRGVTLQQNGTLEVTDGIALGLAGMVSGAGDLLKTGSGALRLTKAGNSYGNTIVEAGTLVGNSASISGNLSNAGTVIFDQPANGTFTGDIGGFNGSAGSVIKQGAGELVLTGTSSLDWSIDAGSLTTAAERFDGNADIAAAASFTFNQSADASWDGALTGAGRFVKSGAGALFYDGSSPGFTGTTEISGGALVVGSSANHIDAVLGGSFVVENGGTLAGHGTIGSGTGSFVTVAAGGALSPGNSPGTLTVEGNLVLDTGSRIEVEVIPQETGSDLVHVTGDATIDGGSVAHIGATGNYALRSTYTILTADGTLSGRFDNVSSDYAFLTPVLGYDYGAGIVNLTLERNDAGFAGTAVTGNQQATAGAIDSIGIAAGNRLYDAIALLPGDKGVISASFDMLSGEVHASTKTALIEDSAFIRDAATDRIRAAFADVGASPLPVMAYSEGGARLAGPTADGSVIWTQASGAWNHVDSDGNAAGLDTASGGFIVGADAPVFNSWRLGALAAYGRTDFSAHDRSSSGDSDNYTLGLYGGTQVGNLGFRSGLAYTWNDIDTNRSVAFPGFSDSLESGSHAGSFQAFGDLGYRIDTPAVSLEPFANLAYVSLTTDGFTEEGGAAALHVDGETTDATFSTLGLRAAATFQLGETTLTARASFGWRHAFGDTTPLSTQTFSAGDAFTIAGVPIALDTAIVDAGLDLNLSPTATFGLSYSGQAASSGQQQGFKASVNVKF
ncbi:MAG TPA: autotransporter domain-containing protein [Devosiaceae bacterium]|jgi:outer membrane autotransporter protein